jgi:hypothetical protein
MCEKCENRLRPRTLNLQWHAEQGINNLTRNLDERENYIPYFWTMYHLDPPEARHGAKWWDFGDQVGRYLEALLLARVMTGNTTNLESDEHLKREALNEIEEDGLAYTRERPWCEHVVNVFNNRSLMLGLINWYWLDKDEKVKDAIDRMIGGLSRIAVHKDDYAYFPYGLQYSREKGWYKDSPHDSSGDALCDGVLITGLMNYYELTGSASAIKFAGELANYYLGHGPEFNDKHQYVGHSHSMMATVAAIIRYGVVTSQPRYVEWGKKVYDWAKSLGSQTGWFPEFVERFKITNESCETCHVVDMMECALNLWRAGHPSYINDVERYVRNQLIENQLLDTDWIKNIANAETVFSVDEIGQEKVILTDSKGKETRDVVERTRGGFAGWAGANDWVGPNPLFRYLMMNCCSAAGVRSLYIVWNNIVSKKDDGVYVNLNISRDTEWVDVDSYHPYEGKLEIFVHNAPTLFVRIPDWVRPPSVQVFVNGKLVESVWNRKYVTLRDLKAGDKVTVQYLLEVVEKKELIGGRDFTLQWKGDTVVKMDPPGEIKPLYQRDAMLAGKAPMEQFDYHQPKINFPW